MLSAAVSREVLGSLGPEVAALAGRISRTRNRPLHRLGGAHPPFPPGALDVADIQQLLRSLA